MLYNAYNLSFPIQASLYLYGGSYSLFVPRRCLHNYRIYNVENITINHTMHNQGMPGSSWFKQYKLQSNN
jgi:hypothetical protein